MIPQNLKKITNFFSGGGVYVSPLISSWYNSLIVKPSDQLLSDLNDLVDGINTDGNWTLFDLFHQIGGMETDEQRLRPLISTSGNDFDAVNSPTLNVNGVTGDGATSYLDLRWNPTNDSSNYTLNDASFGFYSRTASRGSALESQIGSRELSTGNSSLIYSNFISNMLATINSNIVSYNYFKSNTQTDGLISLIRTASNNIYGDVNGTPLTSATDSSSAIPTLDFYLCGHNQDNVMEAPTSDNLSSVYVSNSSIDTGALTTRIQTFMTARGI